MTLRKIIQKKKRMLGELEEAILEVLWKRGQGTVREVLVAFGQRRLLAYTTVMTVMTRMVEKGLLCRQSLADGSFLYKPCYLREEFYAKTNRALFSDLIRNFGSVAVAQFVDTLEEIDPKQLELLKARLKSHKQSK